MNHPVAQTTEPKAPVASNETRLPQAVVRRSAAIQARLDAQKAEPGAAPAASGAPPASPSTPATATTAEGNPPAPSVPREETAAYWKQRFDVTSGLLRVEREERTQEAAGFNQRIAELQTHIGTLQASVPTPAQDLTQFLSADQIDQIGEEDARVIVATAMKAAQETVRAAIEAEVKPLKDRAAADAGRDLEARKTTFTGALEQAFPGFAEVDVSQGWQAWLAQEDEITGEPRQSLLNRFVSKMDVSRTAALFKAYTKAVTPPVPPVTPNGSAATPNEGRAPAAGAALQPLNGAEIKDFFKRSALGKVKPAERAEFEARYKLPRR